MGKRSKARRKAVEKRQKSIAKAESKLRSARAAFLSAVPSERSYSQLEDYSLTVNACVTTLSGLQPTPDELLQSTVCDFVKLLESATAARAEQPFRYAILEASALNNAGAAFYHSTHDSTPNMTRHTSAAEIESAVSKALGYYEKALGVYESLEQGKVVPFSIQGTRDPTIADLRLRQLERMANVMQIVIIHRSKAPPIYRKLIQAYSDRGDEKKVRKLQFDLAAVEHLLGEDAVLIARYGSTEAAWKHCQGSKPREQVFIDQADLEIFGDEQRAISDAFEASLCSFQSPEQSIRRTH